MSKKHFFAIVLVILAITAITFSGCASARAESRQPQMLHIIDPIETTATKTTSTTELMAEISTTTTVATITTAAITTTETPPAPKSELDLYKEESLRLLGGKKQLEGIDISMYQADQDWQGYVDAADAVIIRYSAGTEDLDPYFDEMMSYAMSKHKLVGIYFYTNVNTWAALDAAEYARWCIDHTKEYLGYAIYVLDAEEAPLLDTQWILTYLRTFKAETGVKPILYTGQHKLNQAASTDSTAEALRTIRAESYGLWIARYGENDGEVYDFDVFLWEENKVFGHQYVSKVENLDRDIFYCTPSAWYEFAKQAIT